MKKLMIAAAVAALTAGAFAAACSEGGDDDCDGVTFKISFSGKTADQYYNKDGSYKDYAAVQKISGKGTLKITDYATETFTSAKLGKLTVATTSEPLVLNEGEVIKWSYFGKDLEKASGDSADSKPGKSYTLESDLGIVYEDATEYEITVTEVAFGKVKVKLSKGGTKTSECGEETTDPCVPTLTPKSYKGWFAGWFSPACMDAEGYDDGCCEFDAEEIALIGGTWSAK